jgi:hypothetical protein
MRRILIASLAAAAILLVGAGSALAGPSRSTKSVAGARATLLQWVHLLVTGQEKAACALLTTHGQAAWVKDSGSKKTTCVGASTDVYKYFKQYPQDGASLKKYAVKVTITLSGTKATMPKVSGGTRTMLYIKGLWYIDS